MHYRNGRAAKNGDKVVQLGSYDAKITALGELRNATPGNDHCNGEIVNFDAAAGHLKVGACLCDCLHVEDVAALLAEKGLDKRPPGK